MDPRVLSVVSFVINLCFFLAVAALLAITLMELKFHFNLGNKISLISVLISTGMRMSLTIEEFATRDYTRQTWKFYYKWIIECAFMVFYLHVFYKTMGNRILSQWVSERSKATKHLPL